MNKYLFIIFTRLIYGPTMNIYAKQVCVEQKVLCDSLKKVENEFESIVLKVKNLLFEMEYEKRHLYNLISNLNDLQSINPDFIMSRDNANLKFDLLNGEMNATRSFTEMVINNENIKDIGQLTELQNEIFELTKNAAQLFTKLKKTYNLKV